MRLHIRALKFVILGVALLLLSILLIYTQPQIDLIPLSKTSTVTIDENDELSVKEVKEPENKEEVKELLEKTITQSPNFTGEDENNKVWKLKAKEALQAGKIGEGITNLIDVFAETLSSSEQKVDYKADEGDYLPGENKIVLRGNVEIIKENLKLETQELTYNFITGFAQTLTRTYISSEIGTLEGDALKSYNNADKLVLEGNVHAILYKKKNKEEF